MDTDWIYLTYKVHNHIENMIVPEQTNVPRTGWRNWTLYAAFLMYKYYTKDTPSWIL